MESIIIYLNIKCNIDCDYCFVNKKDSFMDRPRLEKVLRWFIGQEGREKRINFLGGEPTLSADLLAGIRKFLDGIGAGKTIVIEEIPTNGIVIDEKMLANLKQDGIKLAFSLDGLEFEHNKHWINKKATFDRILKGLELYTKHCGVPRIKCTVHPDMGKDLDKRIAGFLKKGFKEIQIHPVFALPWSAQQVQAYRESIERLMRSYSKFLKTGRNDIRIYPFESATACHLGSEPVVMPDGKAYACTMVMNYHSDLIEEFCIGHIDTGIDLEKMRSLLNYKSCENNPSKFCCRRLFDTNTRGLASPEDVARITELDAIEAGNRS